MKNRQKVMAGVVLSVTCVAIIGIIILVFCVSKDTEYTGAQTQFAENLILDSQNSVTETTTVAETFKKEETTTLTTTKSTESQENKKETSTICEVAEVSISYTTAAKQEKTEVVEVYTTNVTPVTSLIVLTTSVENNTSESIITDYIFSEEQPEWAQTFPQEIMNSIGKELSQNPGMEISLYVSPVSQSAEGFSYNYYKQWKIPEELKRWAFATYIMEECNSNGISLSEELIQDDPWNMLENRKHTVAKCVERMLIQNNQEDYELLSSNFTEFESWYDAKRLMMKKDLYIPLEIEGLFQYFYYNGLWSDTTYDEYLFAVMKNYPARNLVSLMDEPFSEYGITGFSDGISYEIANIKGNHFISIFVSDSSGEYRDDVISRIGFSVENFFSSDQGKQIWKSNMYSDF